MTKHTNIFIILITCVAALVSFCSCGEKENGTVGGNSEAADYPAVLNNTRWRWTGGSDVIGVNCVEITFFNADKLASLIMTTSNYTVDRYDVTYNYSDGSGTMTLVHRETGANSSASFTVRGDKLTLLMGGATYILPLFNPSGISTL